MQRRLVEPAPPGLETATERWFDPGALGITRPAIRIIAIKLTGLLLLFFFTLYLLQPRLTLADAALDSLLVQTDALVASLEVGGREGAPMVAVGPPEEVVETSPVQVADEPLPLVTRIARDRVEELFARILEGSDARAALYGMDGSLLTDSQIALRTQSDLTTVPLPPIAPPERSPLLRGWEFISGLVLNARMANAAPAQPSETASLSARRQQILDALGGVKTAERYLLEGNDLIVAVAAPVHDINGTIVGALELRSGPGAIITRARAQELALMRGFALAAVVLIATGLIISFLLTRPLKQLAKAADRIKSGDVTATIPTLEHSGHLGRLSHALSDMTRALYMRIDANEAFAGEVAHELKNPLTSLRSAVETLPLAKTDRSRNELLGVIEHDVRRIDRLISDISEASKLDAELTEHRYERFDLIAMLRAVVQTQADLARERDQTVELIVHGGSRPGAFAVVGRDSRLGQVFTNLIDNARSFTPDGGIVSVMVQRYQTFIEAVVDDVGPGIEEAMLERIFERFYTDRAEQRSFGNNSGLGLAISRQIIDAHHGEIFAENRYRTSLGAERTILGARFTVRLPAAE